MSPSAQWSSPLYTKSSIELLSVTCVFNTGITRTHKEVHNGALRSTLKVA